MSVLVVTSCFLVRKASGKATEVCLGLKKTGFGKGRWVGVGGKLELGESPLQAVTREAKEEFGVVLNETRQAGIINFIYSQDPFWNHQACIYISKNWSGTPQSSPEIDPRWFPYSNIPYDEMWPDNKLWLPFILEGKTIKGSVTYGGNKNVTEHEINIVEKL